MHSLESETELAAYDKKEGVTDDDRRWRSKSLCKVTSASLARRRVERKEIGDIGVLCYVFSSSPLS